MKYLLLILLIAAPTVAQIAFQIAQFGPGGVSNLNQEDLLIGFTF